MERRMASNTASTASSAFTLVMSAIFETSFTMSTLIMRGGSFRGKRRNYYRKNHLRCQMKRNNPPSVVLVGRPNVGKSTLFNRLTGRRRAIVAPIAGTTRDVIAHPAEWQGRRFEVVDTGGMFGASQDPLHELVLERGRRAVEDADLLVLLVDGREGLVPGDREISKVLRAADKPVIVAVNKSDDKRAVQGAMEFYQLGFEPILEISAEHGEGTGDLLDGIVEKLDIERR